MHSEHIEVKDAQNLSHLKTQIRYFKDIYLMIIPNIFQVKNNVWQKKKSVEQKLPCGSTT